MGRDSGSQEEKMRGSQRQLNDKQIINVFLTGIQTMGIDTSTNGIHKV